MNEIVQISVPLMYGANKSGLENGINMIKNSISKDKLIEIEISGNINVEQKMRNLDIVLNTARNLAHEVEYVLNDNNFPLIIGGDHSVSLGSISASSKYHENLGVIWIDAHGDMNTNETSPSGNIHGMVLAALQGFGNNRLQNILTNGVKVSTQNIVIIGVRDLDVEEEQLMKQVNIMYITYKEILEKGLENVMKQVQEYLKGRVKHMHISLDLDSMDPVISPGVSVPVQGGFNKNDIRYINDFLFDS